MATKYKMPERAANASGVASQEVRPVSTYDHTTPAASADHLDTDNSPRGFVRVSDVIERIWSRLPQPVPTHDSNPDGHRLNFAELCDRDPHLAEMAREIASLPRHYPSYCANAAWFGLPGYKRRITDIVGYLAEQPDAALRTSAAYETAYHTLYHALPNCQHDGFCRWEPPMPDR